MAYRNLLSGILLVGQRTVDYFETKPFAISVYDKVYVPFFVVRSRWTGKYTDYHLDYPITVSLYDTFFHITLLEFNL